ncbi:GSCOCG00009640001-RA-CDS [Cotesia congregata]|uniref:Similar to SCARB1: Scavenger receptor class B member 1 (Homo sapiens) n=1 Tax=Cotesia congregata TaxID=51543 RepID=A0A8J2MRX4_COTCN|nr:GSCOCG00009640001-RA-CDS [Cotesia congregata]CAG5103083.1 Similar to SCARB1: Scavenger receptor class B member 1 (Homo sapiens) [Cotesia congregata]
MKTSQQLQEFKKCLIIFMVGIICTILSCTIYALDPINIVFKWKLTMTPTSTVFLMWKKPPVDVFLKVYVFNITNAEAFLNNEEKLRVQEVGPYVYQEVLENTKIVWHDNGTITYIPKRTVIYRPDMSINDPKKDIVTVTNIPFLGISSALADAGFFVNFPLVQLTNLLDTKPIVNMTVYEYFWGYEDPLVRLASGIVPNFINFQKFGLLDRMYDEGDNLVNLNIQKNKNMSDENGRYLSIQNYNGSPGLAHWGYQEEEGNETIPGNTICNRIRGATEGTLFPSNLDKSAVFRVFRKAFCRALPIVFKNEVTTSSGLTGWEYTLSDNFLDPPDMNPENECYCRKMKKCLRKGLSDLTPCYYNIPAAVSLPHFLNADPSLLQDIEGLQPDREKHQTRVVLQPAIGIPIDVNSRIQTNLVMKKMTYNKRLEPFSNLAIPLFWNDLEIPSISPDLLMTMKLLLQIGPIVQTATICLLAIAGGTTFLLSLIGMLWILNQQTEQHSDERRDSVDLKIPLGYGQYTAIRILPAIKKITSKTDLFG